MDLKKLINQCKKEIESTQSFHSPSRKSYWEGKRNAFVYVRDELQKAAQKVEQGDSKNSTPSSEQQTHDVILAAAYNWANGNPNAFGINGFQAGVEWSQKQQHAS